MIKIKIHPKDLFKNFEELDLLPDSVLLTQDNPADGVYYIDKGEVAILVNGELVAHRGSNEYFGEMSCLCGENNASATVKAATDCKVIRINRQHFLDTVTNTPKLWQQLFSEITHRMQFTNKRLSEVLRHTPQGLIKIDPAGNITSEFSVHCISYFENSHLVGKSFHELMFKSDEDRKKSWPETYALIFENTFMDFSQVADLLPKETRLVNSENIEKYFELSYYPCRDQNEAIIAVDIGIEDITEKFELAKTTAVLETERLILQQMYDNPEAFFSVLNLADETLTELNYLLEKTQKKEKYSKERMTELMRYLHSLKGSSGMFSLTQIKDTAHHIEDLLKEEINIEELTTLINDLNDHGKTAHELINQMSEELRRRLLGIVITVDQISELKNATEKKDLSKISELIAQIEKIPLKNLIKSWPNEVEKLALQLNKSIQFKSKGENLVINKSTFEGLNNSLIHILRNSIDHGIESPHTRAKALKDECGTILFNAFIDDRDLIIEISDDGGGLNNSRIIKIAKSKPHLDQKIIDNYINANEVWRILFLPGFSTAETVTDISGRGVGMDAVLSAIQSLSGTIEIESTQGQGSLFRIRIPR